MEIENRLEVLGIISVLLFGAFIGSAVTYQQMDSRLDILQEKVDNIQPREKTIPVNESATTSLSSLFENTDQSVVSVQATGNRSGVGSGFIYSENGYIVTNHHVVEGADRVEVTFTDGETREPEIVGSDVYSDLAVLKVDKSNLEPLELGNSSNVVVGERAVAIGNPFGLRSSMTAGIVSQTERQIRGQAGFSIPGVIQTDASINPGNSGGPLLNGRGEVIGVNTAIQSNTGTFSGVGLAIPANTVRRIIPEIIEKGDYDHPWIGVSGRTVSPELAEAMNLSENRGFHILEVIEDSPAEQAGIRPGNETVEIQGREMTVGGDVIVEINGQEMRGIDDILLYLEKKTRVGETVNIKVIRDGETKTLQLTLEDRPDD